MHSRARRRRQRYDFVNGIKRGEEIMRSLIDCLERSLEGKGGRRCLLMLSVLFMDGEV